MKYLKLFEDMSRFNLDEFKLLNTFQKRKDYCDRTLIKVNSGSSRIVYNMGNNKCLKLAKNKRGYIQNDNENEDWLQKSYGDILSQLFETFYVNDNCVWLISELATKTNEERFEERIGISFELYVHYISERYYSNRPELDRGRNLERLHRKFLNMDDIRDNEEKYYFPERVSQLIADADVAVGDLSRIASYGEVIRDGESMIVIVDYGADDEYMQTFHRKIR
jgi:hypothetical protein